MCEGKKSSSADSNVFRTGQKAKAQKPKRNRKDRTERRSTGIIKTYNNFKLGLNRNYISQDSKCMGTLISMVGSGNSFGMFGKRANWIRTL